MIAFPSVGVLQQNKLRAGEERERQKDSIIIATFPFIYVNIPNKCSNKWRFPKQLSIAIMSLRDRGKGTVKSFENQKGYSVL